MYELKRHFAVIYPCGSDNSGIILEQKGPSRILECRRIAQSHPSWGLRFYSGARSHKQTKSKFEKHPGEKPCTSKNSEICLWVLMNTALAFVFQVYLQELPIWGFGQKGQVLRCCHAPCGGNILTSYLSSNRRDKQEGTGVNQGPVKPKSWSARIPLRAVFKGSKVQ